MFSQLFHKLSTKFLTSFRSFTEKIKFNGNVITGDNYGPTLPPQDMAQDPLSQVGSALQAFPA